MVYRLPYENYKYNIVSVRPFSRRFTNFHYFRSYYFRYNIQVNEIIKIIV